MQRQLRTLMMDGKPVQWLGANFWSRAGGPRMWARYDPVIVRSELATLKSHGCTMTRSFCYWPDFEPAPQVLDETVIDRFVDFLSAHHELDLSTIPTFIVGHMSGENWDPGWRNGRDLYRDVWMVNQQAWFVEQIARRVATHPAISGWLLTNEMPLYGGEDDSAVVTAWAELLIRALRAGGANQPASIGDGAWGIEASGHDNGFSLRRLAPTVDFVGPHVYPMGDDQARQHSTAAFACEMSAVARLPVILEEFGVSSDFVADDHAADYYRQVLYSTLLAGATGWIAWNNCDYDDLSRQDPYRHHPFEMHFGLTDRDGAAKAQLEELADFAGFVRSIDLSRCRRPDADAALVVPEHFESGVFLDESDRQAQRDTLLQAYVVAKESDLSVGMVRDVDGIDSGCRLYLVPSAKAISAPGWMRLEELAGEGATVYYSYCPGVTKRQRGPWSGNLNRLFGDRHRLRYGLTDPIDEDRVRFEILQDFGSLRAGTSLSFTVAGNGNGRAYLPVEPDGAEVIAVDGHGRPALLRHPVGNGTAVLCTYPLEYMASQAPRVNPEDTWRIYDALATYAGVRRPVRVDDPRVFVDHLIGADGADLVFLISQHDEKLEVTPTAEAGARLSPRRADAAAGGPATVALAPYGVAVLTLQR
jgi:endo-1,4-beta-mannosidase